MFLHDIVGFCMILHDSVYFFSKKDKIIDNKKSSLFPGSLMISWLLRRRVNTRKRRT